MSLDTRGIMSGFVQGFGMMDQYHANQHNRRLADRRMEMAEQQFADNRDYEQELRARQRQDWDAADATDRLQNIFAKASSHGYSALDDADLQILTEINTSRPDMLPPEFRQWVQSNQQNQGNIGLVQDRVNQAGQSQQERQGLRQQRDQMGLQQGVERRTPQRYSMEGNSFTAGSLAGNPEAVQAGLSRFFEGGEPSEEEAAALLQSPVDLTYIGTPQMTADMQAIDEQMRLLEQGEEVILQEALDAINNIYDFQVGEGKRITSILPGKEPGTLVFGLDIEGEEGADHEPMTEGRRTAADGDGRVKQVRVDDLLENLAGAKSLHVAFTTNPEARERLNNWAVAQGYFSKPEQQEQQEQWITTTDEFGRVTRINAQTGRAESVHGHLPNNVLGAGGSSQEQDTFLQERITSTINNLQRMTLQEGEFGPMAPEIRMEQESRILGALANEVFGPEGTPEMAQDLLQVARSEGRQPTMQDVQWILEETRRGEQAALEEMERQRQLEAQQQPQQPQQQGAGGVTWQGARQGARDFHGSLQATGPAPSMSRLDEYRGLNR